MCVTYRLAKAAATPKLMEKMIIGSQAVSNAGEVSSINTSGELAIAARANKNVIV